MKFTDPMPQTITEENVSRQQTKAGIIAFAISVIATIASIRALMFINYGVHSPSDAVIYKWSVILSIGLPFVSIIFALIGARDDKKSNLLGSIAIGISLFLLSSVGFAYFLSSLF